jgi:glycosyltransferase involved in cell wall biosynthesis
MRVIVDYRPALRARSGAGEYVHHAMRAFARRYPGDPLTLFTSSWKDRPDSGLASLGPAVRVSDHRLPVSLLNFAWHRLEWPPVERIARGLFDVAFSPHPLLLPARAAAQIVTVHDLDFMRHPERSEREIARDYPRLAPGHARRARRVVVPSRYTARAVIERFDVPEGRVAVCPPGVPEWRESAERPFAADGYILFVGTLEPRKNVGGLLDAYGRLLARRPNAPKLLIAGKAGPDADRWLQAIAQPPLAGRVEALGYVSDADRQQVYSGARMLVLPSFEEGFGMPALEAMSLGVPVIAARRGNLPDLVGGAGALVDPEDVESIVAAFEALLRDDGSAEAAGRRGIERSRRFSWERTAEALHNAFTAALEER